MHIYSKRAISMIELLIVITVMGLLLGAVLAGMKILEQTKLNNIIADFKKYNVAFLGYTDYYGKLPGKDDVAGFRWGTNCADIADDCNGILDSPIITTSPNSKGVNESVIIWKQLALAKFIEDDIKVYSKIEKPRIGAGMNIPESGIRSHAAYFFTNQIRRNTVLREGYLYPDNVTAIFIGAHHGGGAVTDDTSYRQYHAPMEPALTTSQAEYLSMKLGSSGVPIDGSFRAIEGDTATSYQCWSDATGTAFNGKSKGDLACVGSMIVG